MTSRIIDFSLDHRFAVIALWLVVVVTGIDSLRKLPIDAVPDVTNIQVQVLTDSPGLAPEEVEQFVTFSVETAMSGMPRVQEIRSLSKFGLSVVTVVFEEGTDIYWARQLVSERLAEAREQIPGGYGDPRLAPITTGLGEIYHFELRGEPRCAPGELDTDECYSLMELRSILDWVVNYQLRSVPGVVEVNVFGGEVKTYQVTLDPERLIAYGVGVDRVLTAIRGNNLNAGGGYIGYGGEQYVIRGESLVGSLDDLRSIVVKSSGGTPVVIGDLARVEFAPLLRQGAVTRDGEREAVAGIVLMLLGENSRAVADAVATKVEQIQRTLPPGVVIDPYYDRSDLVTRTIGTVVKNLLEGGVLVVVMLLLLMGSVRGGLLVASVIPLSMLVAFTAMRAAGVSGNLMSLGAIDFGLIVDGAVVVVENILRVLYVRRGETQVSNLEKIRGAAHQVARPVVFGVGIIILVYLPILSLRGIEGKMFRPMALTVVFALAASLVCALTLMPAMASLVLRSAPMKEPPLYRLARRLYNPLLDRALAFRGVTVACAVFVFAFSLVTSAFLGAEFIPTLDEGSIAMHIQRLPSISLERSNEVSLLAERVILEEFPEVETVISRTGRPEVALDPMGVEVGDTFLMLKPKETWRFDTKEELVEAIEASLYDSVPGAVFAFTQPIELRFAELIAGARSDVAIHLYGSDLDLLRQKAEEIAAVVRQVPGAADVQAEQIQGLPLLRVRVDRAEMARYGVDARDVFLVLETLAGKQAGVVLEGPMRFPIQVRFPERLRSDPGAIGDLRVAAPPGPGGAPRMLPLSQLATIEVVEGPAQINRERISRRIRVEANVRGRDLASFVDEARDAVEREVELPSGWSIEWGGQFENLQEAVDRLVVVVPVVLLLIFVLLYSAFGSARLSVLVFLNVPLALSGGILALAARGYPFSISAAVGFIALFGVAVLNGVVLVSYLEEHRQSGVNAAEAARAGASLRLRAVLMTASTDVIGFLPMALSTSAGAEVQRPLATVVVGGLVTATLLTLLVLPVLYSRFAPRT
jgi:cobalt-zinc-cadmium resistance protein CzcA